MVFLQEAGGEYIVLNYKREQHGGCFPICSYLKYFGDIPPQPVIYFFERGRVSGKPFKNYTFKNPE